MANALRQDQPVTGTEVLETLATLPIQIAKELEPLLKSADMAVYKHFLITMYHYTRDAEAQLKFAMDKCSDPVLKEYFREMAREERGHYLLAKRDYEELGGDVSAVPAPASVQSFKDFWYGLGTRNVNEFLGAMYVFENVATKVGKEVVNLMKRLDLTKRQSRWLLVHLEADVGHGDEAFKMCQSFVEDDPEAMLLAAQSGAKEWMAVFRHAFSNIG